MFGIFQAVIILTLLMIVLTGCATAVLIDDAFIGDPVELDFHVVHADLPNAMVYWRESPGFTESAMTVNPPYAGCTKVNFYVNPAKKAKPLGRNAKEFSLLSFYNEATERALWNNIPVSDKCAVLLTVGTIKGINFTGISASTRAGYFKRTSITFPEPVPPDSSAVPGVFFAPLFDAVFWVGYWGYYPITRPLCPSAPDSVRVSFHFPDGTSKETVITDDGAKALVDEKLPIFSCHMYCPHRVCVSYWLIAAMLDLRVDFRYGNGLGDLRIEDYQGSWNYRINGVTQIKSKVWEIEDNTNQIDFILNDSSEENQ